MFSAAGVYPLNAGKVKAGEGGVLSLYQPRRVKAVHAALFR